MFAINPSLDYLERAYDDGKYGEFSRQPYMDGLILTKVDPSMAPPGKHVMSLFVQYAPYHLNGGWTDERREALGDTVVNTLAEYMPDLKQRILHRQVVTPVDIEKTIGITGGNIFHGELSLHQLFSLRPSARWCNYRTPVPGFWQCGSGTHPGGCVSGTSAMLAAQEILRAG